MDKSVLLQQKITRAGITFDDVLLLPGFTDFKREEVSFTTQIHPRLKLTLPVVSSPMDTVTEEKMALMMACKGGLGIIHRNLNIDAQQAMVKKVKQHAFSEYPQAACDHEGKLLVGAAVGTGSDLKDRGKALVEAEVDVIVVDSGHGFTKFVIEAVKYIKNTYPNIPLMAGNVATFDGARALIEAGADILRVGMGPGSICTTRIVTGMGVPQLSAVMEAVRATADTKVTVVADGGIRQIGDMAKALAVGAQGVMLGSLLARFAESPGETITMNGKKYKTYRGMGSVAAMKQGGAERYGQSKNTESKKLVAEGVEGLVEFRGEVGDYLDQIQGSLRSSLYYIGARNLNEFFQKARLIKISRAGMVESHPHTITITNPGENYSS